MDTSICVFPLREITSTPCVSFLSDFWEVSNQFTSFFSLYYIFQIPCLSSPCSSSSSKLPGRRWLMRFTTWTPLGHLRLRSAVLDESAKIILRFLSGCKVPGQNRNVTIIRARARAQEGLKNNGCRIITKIPPGETICVQIYLISGKSVENQISYNFILRPYRARTRAYKSNVWHLTWAFVN